MGPKLSTIIITLNEAKNLAECLKSLERLNSEVVLVDSGSTDETVEIAKKNGVKVFIRKFDNFSNQRNFATEKTSGDWIFSIDPDEIVTKELADEIKGAITTEEFKGFLIGRRNFILGGEIKHTWWSPDRHVWLWKKGFGKWQGKVHEELQVDGQVGLLKNSKLHYQDETIRDFIKTLNRYSALRAHQLKEEGVRFSFIKMIFYAKREFFIRFLYKLGFLDGWRGFILSILMSVYHYMVWIKLSQLNQER